MKLIPTMTPSIDVLATDDGPRLFKISVSMFHELEEAGILTPEDRCELIDGELYQKEKLKAPHARLIAVLTERLSKEKFPKWHVRCQLPITLSESEPSPALTIVRHSSYRFRKRHPGPGDIGIVIEVAELRLRLARKQKMAAYAREGVPVYWIVNLVDKKIEVYSKPIDGEKVKYSRRKVYKAGAEVPLVLDGVKVAQLKTDGLFRKTSPRA